MDRTAEALLASDSRAQYFIERLKDRDERWAGVRPGWLMKLARTFTPSIIIEALSYIYEQEDTALDPYPYLQSICRRIAERGIV